MSFARSECDGCCPSFARHLEQAQKSQAIAVLDLYLTFLHSRRRSSAHTHSLTHIRTRTLTRRETTTPSIKAHTHTPTLKERRLACPAAERKGQSPRRANPRLPRRHWAFGKSLWLARGMSLKPKISHHYFAGLLDVTHTRGANQG